MSLTSSCAFKSSIDYLPGFLLALTTALSAFAISSLLGHLMTAPVVVALVLGIFLHSFAARPLFQPGLVFCVKNLLRWAIALLGLRIALGDILSLGLSTAMAVILVMILTIAAGLFAARLFGQSKSYGVLAGAATAVCGASATLATATVLPNYEGKQADIAFIVVGVNALSTIAMMLYPVIAAMVGLDALDTGILLGATIHDVAQVAGAGYAVSDAVGNTAVVVKLFRVFLLLPVVLAIGWSFSQRKEASGHARIPVPVFALVFLALCVVNTTIPFLGGMTIYNQVKAILAEISNWGLLTAIAALGLGTSLTSILTLGWRHLATLTVTTLIIFGMMLTLLAI